MTRVNMDSEIQIIVVTVMLALLGWIVAEQRALQFYVQSGVGQYVAI